MLLLGLTGSVSICSPLGASPHSRHPSAPPKVQDKLISVDYLTKMKDFMGLWQIPCMLNPINLPRSLGLVRLDVPAIHLS